MPRKLTPEEYLAVFNQEYPDYELLSAYRGNKNYVTVRCKKDGNIWRTKPNWLKSGAGCAICNKERQSKNRRKSTPEFIQDAQLVHGNKYDYSLVNYITNKTPITIICPEHGVFLIRPDHFLQGQGCSACADKLNGLAKRLTRGEFISRAKEIHGDTYDYTFVDYVNCDTPVKIICSQHGKFYQTPYVHSRGCGCPQCNASHLEREIKNLLEKNNIKYNTQKKFTWLGLQSLDFYLPDKSIAIECQGSQHYLADSGEWGSGGVVDETIKRDLKKKSLCDEHGVTILYYANDKRIYEISGLYNTNNTLLSKKQLLEKIIKYV